MHCRYRGWHKSRVKTGPHYVLTAPSFEKSHTGIMHQKLTKTFHKEGNLDDYVYVFTKREDIAPDKPKSRAKKVV